MRNSGGGGYIHIFVFEIKFISKEIKFISKEIKFISKEISHTEHEYMNMI